MKINTVSLQFVKEFIWQQQIEFCENTLKSGLLLHPNLKTLKIEINQEMFVFYALMLLCVINLLHLFSLV